MKLKSLRALHEFMDYHHIDSGYALAKKAGLLPGTVNHLLYGRRTTCSYRTARAIEEALGCPKGFLFASGLSKVSDYSTQRSKGCAA